MIITPHICDTPHPLQPRDSNPRWLLPQEDIFLPSWEAASTLPLSELAQHFGVAFISNNPYTVISSIRLMRHEMMRGVCHNMSARAEY